MRAKTVLLAFVSLVCCLRPATGQSAAPPLGPPDADGPVVVRVRFELDTINEIDDDAEMVDFAGVRTLTWHDPRQAFDPAVAGVDEKVYQGAYQFNELSLGWFPQLVLVNEFGRYQTRGVVLRVEPDGTSTLIESIDAAVRVRLNMRRYPFDEQRIEAVFELLGFDRDEVVLELEPDDARTSHADLRVPQWTLGEIELSVREHGDSSALVVSVDMTRRSFFVIRLVILPLTVIVLLSFSVFWLDKSSLGDRCSVSFIGILTSVAYQNVLSESVPSISYFTLMHGFLNLSFFTMCATIVINLVVGAADKKGQYERGDIIDRRCRWIFPCTYFGLMLVMLVVAFTYF